MTEPHQQTARTHGQQTEAAMTDAAALLRARADSYWRDARTLRDLGDEPAAVIFETVADELRTIADQISIRELSTTPVGRQPI